MGFNIAKLMQQAKEMQKKMETEQAANATKEFVGKAGASAVQATLNGLYEVKKISLEANVTTGMESEDKEVLEDLITAAVNDAVNQIKAEAAKSMEGLGAGMDLGALKNLMPK
jgi:DNA-binding YbaB/EbfC family protein